MLEIDIVKNRNKLTDNRYATQVLWCRNKEQTKYD